MKCRQAVSVESTVSSIVSKNHDSSCDRQIDVGLSLVNQQRLVNILDQFMIDVEEGRTVDAAKLLRENPDIASEIEHYLGGIRLARDAVANEYQSSLPGVQGDLKGDSPPAPLNLAPSNSDPSNSTRSIGMVVGRLGAYVLGPIIGQGAMGVVYKARDTVQQRDVAVKVLSYGTSLDRTRIDRFRLEAKTAASLDHPNVVPVYSVGFDKGIHYYAMQLIDGESLERRIASARLVHPSRSSLESSSKSSLERNQQHSSQVACSAAPLVGRDRYRRISQLGVSAANALHSAHSAGIVHRDIKPSNLVLGYDGQLWVTDFGLARVQSEVGLTRTGEIVGTLRYMSPEQARGQGDLIDARTDVYGLGATLYELVARVPAIAGDDAVTILNDIQFKSPAALRSLDAAVPRDLEIIISRAMRPRPVDRYPTAAAMAADLQRFVEGRRIYASSISVAERAIAWARHHKQLAGSLLAIWSCLLFASFATTYFVSNAQAKTIVALLASEEHYRQARRSVDTLGAQIARRLSAIPGAASIQQDVLAETMRYYEQFIESSIDDPKLAHDVARTRLQIARLTVLSGTFADADRAYLLASQALVRVIEQRHDGDDERYNGAVLDYVRALNEWSLIASNHGDQRTALSRLGTALRHLADAEFSSPEMRLQASLVEALTRNNRGVVLLRSENRRQSKNELEQAIAILRKLPEDAAENAELASELADAFSNISALLSEVGQYADAAVAAHQSTRLQSAEDLMQGAEGSIRLAISHNNLAALQWRSGDVRQAIAAYRSAVTLLEQAIQQTPTSTVPRDRLAVTLNNLGMALASVGDDAGAEQVLVRSASLAKPARDADPSDAEAAKRLASIHNNLGVLMRNQGRSPEAEKLFRSALQTIALAECEDSGSVAGPPVLRQVEANLKSVSHPRMEDK